MPVSSFAPPSTDPLLNRFEILTSWLEKVAENTAKIRDLTENPGRIPKGAKEESDKGMWERVGKAIGDRFESAYSRLRNAPAEKVVGSALDGFTQKLDRVVTGMESQVRSLASRGFGGTVERARLDYALEQLGRQMAAVFKPVIDGAAYAAVELEKRFRAMGGGEQNRLMGAGLGALAGYRLGGPLGALAGGALGAVLAPGGGESRYDPYLAAAGGAYLGFRTLGVPGALAGAGAGYAAGTGDYGMARKLGASRVMAGLGAAAFATAELGETILEPFGWTSEVAKMRKEGRAKAGLDVTKPAEPRRDVTPFSADPLAAGGTADLIQKAMIRATAGADFEENSPFKPLIDIGLRVIDLLTAALTGGGVPPPRSAGG